MAQTVTSAIVLMENDLPAKVLLRTVDEPALDDFIDLPVAPKHKAMQVTHWSNGVLLQVKNRTLPRMIQEKSSADLLDRVTRIEKAILDLDLHAEQLKNRAQVIIEQGQGDGSVERDLAILFKQRIEIFKSILSALKQGAARTP